MFTVVIPTMWKFSPFVDFLGDMTNTNLISEIIIIDNDRKNRPHDLDLYNRKIILLDYGRNIFVNPAWNIGVSLSNNDRICIQNDDIIYDLKVFDKIKNYSIDANTGVIGLNVQDNPTGLITCNKISSGCQLNHFPLLMFVWKQNYIPIPDELLIGFGDNFIFDNAIWNNLQISVIENMFFYSPYSVTMNSEEICKIKYDIYTKEKQAYKDILIKKGIDPSKWCPEHF